LIILAVAFFRATLYLSWLTKVRPYVRSKYIILPPEIRYISHVGSHYVVTTPPNAATAAEKFDTPPPPPTKIGTNAAADCAWVGAAPCSVYRVAQKN